MKGANMFSNILVRLAVYYVALISLTSGIFSLFPDILYYIGKERMRSSNGASMDFGAAASTALENAPEGLNRLIDPATSIPVLGALLLAFAFTLPVTWVYHWTRPRKRYNQAFAHTLLVVPVAIALVVFLVKGSLALAFSLAGIVAAVRFRTSLNEPMDAVYMFIVIGIGLAAGVQLLNVAIFASLIFNAVALTVWKADFGSQPAILSGWNLIPPAESGQLLGVSGAAQPDSPTTGDKAQRPYNAQLRVHTTRIESAQLAAIPILESDAKQWRQARVIQNEDGTSIVEFDVRLKKSTDLPAFIRKIEESEQKHVGKVELKKRKPAKE
jgi:hypothetical protein